MIKIRLLLVIILIRTPVLITAEEPSKTKACNRIGNSGVADLSSSMLFALNYASNTNTFGTFNQFVKQPSYTTSFNFFSKYKIDFSAYGIFIENSDDSLSSFSRELDLGIAYSFEIGDQLLIYPSYTRFLYSENSNSLKSDYTDNLQLDINYDLSWYQPGLSASYIIGKENSLYFYLMQGFSIDQADLFFQNTYFYLGPEIDFIIGQQTNYERYIWESILQSPRLLFSYKRLANYVYTDFRDYRQNTGSKDYTFKDYLDDKIEETTKRPLRLTTIAATLPLYYMIGDFSVSFSVMAFFPVNQPDYLNSSTELLFDVGVSYIFNL